MFIPEKNIKMLKYHNRFLSFYPCRPENINQFEAQIGKQNGRISIPFDMINGLV